MNGFYILLALGVDVLGSANRFNLPTPLLFVATEGSEVTEHCADMTTTHSYGVRGKEI